jgi:hypothetical protein
MIALAVLAAMPTLSGCVGTAAPSPCAGWRWIEVPEADLETMTADLAAQLRAHNERFLTECEG